MVLLIDGICIASNRGNLLYWTSFLGGITRSSLHTLANEAVSGDAVTLQCRDGGIAVHIKRGGCCWLITTATNNSSINDTSSSISISQKLSLVQALEWLYEAVMTTLLGAESVDGIGDWDDSGGVTKGAKTTATTLLQNSPTIHQIVLNMASCGVLQLQPLPRVLSELSLQQRQPPLQQSTTSLFGVMHLPASLSQYSPGGAVGPTDGGTAQLQSVCLDVVERICGNGVVGGDVWGTSLTSGEVRGSVTLKCPKQLLNSAVSVTFSSTIPDQPAVNGGVHVVSRGSRVSWDGRTARVAALHQPTACLLQYSLGPTLPYTLHCTTAPLLHSNSDCEVVAAVCSSVGSGVLAPSVRVTLQLPHLTDTVTTRTTGHHLQGVEFSPRAPGRDPSLTWTISRFPGDAEAKAFIRLVGCGRDSRVSRASLDFEVSQWLSSGLRVDSLTTSPTLAAAPWVRYLTIGESIRLAIQQSN